jgi:uncharacterized membrane protein (DUF373 family)
MNFFRGLINMSIIALLCWAVLFAVIAAFTCSCTQYVVVSPGRYEQNEYFTYAAEPFKRTVFLDLYERVDTVHVLSVTVKGGVIEARIVESDFPITVKYPDRLEAVNGRP